MNIDELQVGRIYLFQISDWEAPTGEVIAGGKDKRRIFLGYKPIDGIPFVEVQRETGKRHLIAVETVKAVRPVTQFH